MPKFPAKQWTFTAINCGLIVALGLAGCMNDGSSDREPPRLGPELPLLHLQDSALWFPVVGSGWIILDLQVGGVAGKDPAIGVEWDTSQSGAYASAFIEPDGRFDIVNFGPRPAVHIVQGESNFGIVVLAVYQNASEGDALVIAPAQQATRSPNPSNPTATGTNASWGYYGEGRRPGMISADVTDARAKPAGGAVGPGRLSIKIESNASPSGIMLSDFYVANMTPASTIGWSVGGEAASLTLIERGAIGRAVFQEGLARTCFFVDSPAPMLNPSIEVATVVVPFELSRLGNAIKESFETTPASDGSVPAACE